MVLLVQNANKAYWCFIYNLYIILIIFIFSTIKYTTYKTNSLAQLVVEADPDGVIGPTTLDKLNAFDPDHFLAAFTVAKIARYISIVKKRPESRKYFYGWVCRTISPL